ncbi:hypothetical protein HYH03_006407 [Edaphochlamys debaryana]|uniref:SRCR domain-containing protein n=1 Tax=Edaphochlamys debaryana TaxID=47281 RepID=A0A836C126_9CHLO|nr:hypothetical protein HYH03_006407 [Edaphochlamys debaryana]|eukprot:KAG2495462.1 hypothetical protein HYH03_006407 [Edaphochlamys debaryana]
MPAHCGRLWDSLRAEAARAGADVAEAVTQSQTGVPHGTVWLDPPGPVPGQTGVVHVSYCGHVASVSMGGATHLELSGDSCGAAEGGGRSLGGDGEGVGAGGLCVIRREADLPAGTGSQALNAIRAAVLCHRLGYRTGRYKRGSKRYGGGSGLALTMAPVCAVGTYATLAPGWGTQPVLTDPSACRLALVLSTPEPSRNGSSGLLDHGWDLSLDCFDDDGRELWGPPPPPLAKRPRDGDLRLMSYLYEQRTWARATGAAGFVQVYRSAGGWGAICGEGWGVAAADVACRQLGFAGGGRAALLQGPTGLGDMSARWHVVHMTHVRCSSQLPTANVWAVGRYNLSACDHDSGAAAAACNFANLAAVRCYRTPAEAQIDAPAPGSPPPPPALPPRPGEPGPEPLCLTLCFSALEGLGGTSPLPRGACSSLLAVATANGMLVQPHGDAFDTQPNALVAPVLCRRIGAGGSDVHDAGSPDYDLESDPSLDPAWASYGGADRCAEDAAGDATGLALCSAVASGAALSEWATAGFVAAADALWVRLAERGFVVPRLTGALNDYDYGVVGGSVLIKLELAEAPTGPGGAPPGPWVRSNDGVNEYVRHHFVSPPPQTPAEDGWDLSAPPDGDEDGPVPPPPASQRQPAAPMAAPLPAHMPPPPRTVSPPLPLYVPPAIVGCFNASRLAVAKGAFALQLLHSTTSAAPSMTLAACAAAVRQAYGIASDGTIDGTVAALYVGIAGYTTWQPPGSLGAGPAAAPQGTVQLVAFCYGLQALSPLQSETVMENGEGAAGLGPETAAAAMAGAELPVQACRALPCAAPPGTWSARWAWCGGLTRSALALYRLGDIAGAA